MKGLPLALIGIVTSIILAYVGFVTLTSRETDNKVYAQSERISSLEADNQTLKEDIKEIKENQKDMQGDFKTLQVDITSMKLDIRTMITILNKYK